jgi:hypothetical protein
MSTSTGGRGARERGRVDALFDGGRGATLCDQESSEADYAQCWCETYVAVRCAGGGGFEVEGVSRRLEAARCRKRWGSVHQGRRLGG